MKMIEATGKSVDEAIFNGLIELGISIDEVEVEIIQQETKGILGLGAKPAKVRLTEREKEQIVLPDYMLKEQSSASEKKENRRNDRQKNDRQKNSNRQRREEKTPREPKKEYDYSLEAAEGNIAADFVKGVLERMGIEADVLVATNVENGMRLRIDSESMGRLLIGHRGETLDALQYLTSLTVNHAQKDEEYTRVTLDTEGYRDKREDTLARLARKVAAQVKATGKSREMEPMNPYERRVFHSTLQNNPYVTTYSEGEGNDRRVIVAPKENAK
ncbi:MAG: protein jag [Clostridia bacterium]|nr:protein jag [Clostridia bacterium]